MSLYYVLAKTVVNGEMILQGVSVTYSASSSALASASTSFADAAKVAVVDSNAAATVAARLTIEQIYVDFQEVLSDYDITSIITNNLQTTISPIIPLELAQIASSKDGKNYLLKASTIIESNQLLLIRNEQKLTVPDGMSLTNNGIFTIGERNIRDDSLKATTLCPCTNSVAFSNNSSFYNDADGYTTITAGNCMTVAANASASNNNTVVNDGCVKLSGANGSLVPAYWQNVTPGYISNSSTGSFFSNVPPVNM